MLIEIYSLKDKDGDLFIDVVIDDFATQHLSVFSSVSPSTISQQIDRYLQKSSQQEEWNMQLIEAYQKAEIDIREITLIASRDNLTGTQEISGFITNTTVSYVNKHPEYFI